MWKCLGDGETQEEKEMGLRNRLDEYQARITYLCIELKYVL